MFSLVEKNILGGEPIADYVDMICGTSTGGIIGLGLSLNKSADTIKDLYLNRGDEIFPRTLRLGVVKKKYDRAPLDNILNEIFDVALLGDCRTRMVIPSFDHHLEPTIFKTDHHSDYRRDWKKKAAEIAAATSAAPVYLGAYFSEDRIQWDGGLFANHPLMNGIVDALSCYDVSRENIKVLSVGCGNVAGKVSSKPNVMAEAGIKDWALNLIPTASSLQLQDSLGQAGLLIGRQNILRIDPDLETEIALDDVAKATNILPNLAKLEFDKNREKLEEFFETKTSAREMHHSKG